MRISPYKQCLLCIALGPFGLLQLNPVLAIALVIPTACALYVSIEHALYILGASAAISVIFGLALVDRHNRLLVKNFQRSTYIGNVSAKIVRRESADKDYHKVLTKVRRRKLVGRLGTYGFLLVCVAASGMIMAPDIRRAVQSDDLFTAINSESNAASGNGTSNVAPNTLPIIDQRQPIWNQSMHNHKISASLSAVEFQSTSDGFYRPGIILSCQQTNYSVSFSANEILGTDITRLTLTSDGNQKLNGEWQLSESYHTAITTKPHELMGILRSANKITVTYRPFSSEAEKVSTFNLQGSAKAIGVFKERCQRHRSA